MSNICVSSQEEKFIFVVDKYITHHRDSVNNNIFYRKLYVLFAGYHLKYFYSRAQYGNDSNLLIVFYVQIMPDDFVMQLHRF